MKDYRDQSEFHDDIGYLRRLNALLLSADDFSMSLNAFQWYHTLLALYRELSTEMKKEEIEKSEDFMHKTNPRIASHVAKQKKGQKGGIDNGLYISLHEFELFLRKVYKAAGLQMKMKDDPRWALS